VAPDAIFGREAELAAVARFLDAPVTGARALLISGEAGIGKTTIWLEALRRSEGNSRLLRARASDRETALGFAVLTDLVEPAWSDVTGELPPPQQRALESALLLEDPATRLDPRAVALATLGALRSLSARESLVIAIDDVQWVDTVSARALSFALRRLSTERVTVIASQRTRPGARDPIAPVRGVVSLTRLELGPLPVGAMGHILRDLGHAFPRPLVARIHLASGGNPFFAREIGRALIGRGATPRVGEPLPVPDDLHVLLHDRVGTLSQEARDVLLVAASSASPTIGTVAASGGSELAIDEAVDQGFIAIRGSALEFTHPLLASAVYSDATPARRRAVHARLAQVMAEPEERARHLALSSNVPNEEVAAALDGAALRARARGAPEVAAELCELAVDATEQPDRTARIRRAKAHAGYLFDAGDPPRARAILEGLLASMDPGPARAEVLYLLSGFVWKDLGRVSGLLERALQEVGDDGQLRSLILSDLAWVPFDVLEIASSVEHARAAAEIATAVADDGCILRSLSILGLAEFCLGVPTDAMLDRALGLHRSITAADLSSPATCLGRLRTWQGDLDAARLTLTSELQRYRDEGHETARYEILAHLADAEWRAGRYTDAAESVAEAEEIATESAIDVLGEILPVRAAIRCSTGDLEGGRDDAVRALAICDRTGDRWNEVRCRSVLGSLELQLGDPAAAHLWLEPLPSMVERSGITEPSVFPFVPDAVDALVAMGHLELAQRLAERLGAQGLECGRALALGTADRCHGRIAAARGDLEVAAAKIATSINVLGPAQHPLETARSVLLAGEVERRMKRKRSARDLLEDALARFAEIGARPWADKAQREIARIGGRPPSSSDLTPTEQRIATLVAAGRTNREVATASFVSVSTVESNLKRIYRKLGVRSRTELARRLQSPRAL
jgi:DNA-binding CsgD family transcriptional regulator